jgi:HAD superfamily hydrolase (TIGR01509 family)
MNIIIPIGGRGERFSNSGYSQPKPFIPIFEKTMIERVVDNLSVHSDDSIFIIHYSQLDITHLKNAYPKIVFISIETHTRGASETLFLGVSEIIRNHSHHLKCLVLDCDTFYTEDIVHMFRNLDTNAVFYTKNTEPVPIYSYIELDETRRITNIKEKQKISDNANTGAYAFENIHELCYFCKHVLDKNITFNGEPYTSCVISSMISSGFSFVGYELSPECVFSLGTPAAVQKYIGSTFAFLFDLDGTLVITDDVYYDVWREILANYDIEITPDMFSQYIYGNTDQYVLATLLNGYPIPLKTISDMKDSLFIRNIHRIRPIAGAMSFIRDIRKRGHLLSIITNCNRRVAEEIVRVLGIDTDFIISSSDCRNGKPHSEPYQTAIHKYGIASDKCFVFEDSTTGILSGRGINPRCLVGIQTKYNDIQLKGYGADISFPDFNGLSIDDLTQFNCSVSEKMRSLLWNNSSISDIRSVVIDTKRLKGGFIADVIGFSITDSSGCMHNQVLKYENMDINNLSVMANQLDLYNREYYFYSVVSPFIPIRIPRFYNLVVENGTVSGVVLENLISCGFRNNLDLSIESVDTTLLIIDRMASMHALFWNTDLKSRFPSLNNSCSPIFRPFIGDFIQTRYDEFKMRWFPTFSQRQVELCHDIYTHFSEIQARFSVGSHLTFIHGDIKSPNIFYDVSNANEPWFIDWQHCAIGKGVQDLIFFVIESFDIHNIISMFDVATKYYYERLIVYGINDYSREEFRDDIADAIRYIPFFTSIWFGTTPADELIDKDFPRLFIAKLFHLLDMR